MQTVARLIHGGCKTRIYLVRIGGFDTHDGQVILNDPTHGVHGALLYHLSTAVKAFFDDLAVSGQDEEVVAMTFTDFGRRPFSNASFGTDHGTASPAFVFGKGVEPGVVGTNPDLNNLDPTNNLLIQSDYRQVVTTLLCDWMGASEDAINAAEFSDFMDQKLPLISDEYSDPTTSVEPVFEPQFNATVYPNPTQDEIRYSLYSTKPEPAIMQIFDLLGRQQISREIMLVEGLNEFNADIRNFSDGTYFLSIKDSKNNVLATKQFVKN